MVAKANIYSFGGRPLVAHAHDETGGRYSSQSRCPIALSAHFPRYLAQPMASPSSGTPRRRRAGLFSMEACGYIPQV
ncbi:hypothetical protein M3J09_011599 [Ascochyta lentis]